MVNTLRKIKVSYLVLAVLTLHSTTGYSAAAEAEDFTGAAVAATVTETDETAKTYGFEDKPALQRAIALAMKAEVSEDKYKGFLEALKGVVGEPGETVTTAQLALFGSEMTGNEIRESLGLRPATPAGADHDDGYAHGADDYAHAAAYGGRHGYGAAAAGAGAAGGHDDDVHYGYGRGAAVAAVAVDPRHTAWEAKRAAVKGAFATPGVENWVMTYIKYRMRNAEQIDGIVRALRFLTGKKATDAPINFADLRKVGAALMSEEYDAKQAKAKIVEDAAILGSTTDGLVDPYNIRDLIENLEHYARGHGAVPAHADAAAGAGAGAAYGAAAAASAASAANVRPVWNRPDYNPRIEEPARALINQIADMAGFTPEEYSRIQVAFFNAATQNETLTLTQLREFIAQGSDKVQAELDRNPVSSVLNILPYGESALLWEGIRTVLPEVDLPLRAAHDAPAAAAPAVENPALTAFLRGLVDAAKDSNALIKDEGVEPLVALLRGVFNTPHALNTLFESQKLPRMVEVQLYTVLRYPFNTAAQAIANTLNQVLAAPAQQEKLRGITNALNAKMIEDFLVKARTEGWATPAQIALFKGMYDALVAGVENTPETMLHLDTPKTAHTVMGLSREEYEDTVVAICQLKSRLEAQTAGYIHTDFMEMKSREIVGMYLQRIFGIDSARLPSRREALGAIAWLGEAQDLQIFTTPKWRRQLLSPLVLTLNRLFDEKPLAGTENANELLAAFGVPVAGGAARAGAGAGMAMAPAASLARLPVVAPRPVVAAYAGAGGMARLHVAAPVAAPAAPALADVPDALRGFVTTLAAKRKITPEELWARILANGIDYSAINNYKSLLAVAGSL